MSSDRLRRARVLIVDDSDLMRTLLHEIVEESEQFQVVAQARTGLEAIRLVHEVNPDIVTLDIEMPDLNGLETLGYIMSEVPRPVVIVSSHTDTIGQSAIRAFDFGALEIVPKPAGDARRELATLRARFLEALEAARHARLPALVPRTAIQKMRERRARALPTSDSARSAIAIAASTGGPRALAEIISDLSAGLPCAVLIVQHMPARFTRLFAQRLDDISEVPVVEASRGDLIRAGHIYIAPGGKHLALVRHRNGIAVQLSDDEPLWGVRPAADVLFRDVAIHFGPASAGIVLTGMGRDGADGLRQIQEVGGWTAVQDEVTSVIYGMPRAALPFARRQVPLEQVAATITDIAGTLQHRR